VKAVRAARAAEPLKLVVPTRPQFVRAVLMQHGLLDGLSPEQQKKIAELVLGLWKGAPCIVGLGHLKSPWAKHAPGHIRKLFA
jgi:hypothetical protein